MPLKLKYRSSKPLLHINWTTIPKEQALGVIMHLLIKKKHQRKDSELKTALKSMGPGIITWAADEDSSGIATYSQAGAKFGFGMLWLALFHYPIMIVIEENLEYTAYTCDKLQLYSSSHI